MPTFGRIMAWPRDADRPLELVQRIEGSQSDRRVSEEIDRILLNKEHFSRCEECGQLKPRGWMHDGNICQSCAERNHGVVY